jgi:hypothetical protein
MRIIIGIILGFFIIFNWGSIKDYFDGKLSEGEASVESSQDSSKNKSSTKDAKSTKESKQDLFKDFK